MRPHALSLALLLGDGRLPAGGHAHSGGMEQAVDAGAVNDEPSLAAFLDGRLATTLALDAHGAAAACHLLTPAGHHDPGELEGLDMALDARTASPAARRAARRQGEQHLRAARRVFPSPALEAAAGHRRDPYLCVALGAVAAGAGLEPTAASGLAVHLALSGLASAAVRLLGLDPVEVFRLLASRTPACARLAAAAGAAAVAHDPLPGPAAPGLDRLLEIHHQRKERLFAS